MMNTAVQQTQTTIRTLGGFGVAEEIAWEAMRSTTGCHEARMFFRRLAATARYFHVQLNLADESGVCVLPDRNDTAPSNMWAVLDRASRELDLRMPRAAMTLAQLAIRGKLESARIEIDGSRRFIIGTLTDKLLTDEREWIEADGLPAVAEAVNPQQQSAAAVAAAAALIFPQETASGPGQRNLDKFSAAIETLTEAELHQVVGVYGCFFSYAGRVRRVVIPADIIERTHLPLKRVLEILAHLEKCGVAYRPPWRKGERREWIAVSQPDK
jgi:hypothetical protein